ncbi:hypothetical protein KPATCC21470_4423 [Kitasatospora purpeofusca]
MARTSQRPKRATLGAYKLFDRRPAAEPGRTPAHPRVRRGGPPYGHSNG